MGNFHHKGHMGVKRHILMRREGNLEKCFRHRGVEKAEIDYFIRAQTLYDFNSDRVLHPVTMRSSHCESEMYDVIVIYHRRYIKHIHKVSSWR